MRILLEIADVIILLSQRDLHTQIYAKNETCKPGPNGTYYIWRMTRLRFWPLKIIILAVSLSFAGLLFSSLSGCGNNGHPDVSGVDVGTVHIVRFDTAFFSLDSNKIGQGLYRLSRQYPFFTADFVGNILGLGPLSDTSQTAFEGTRLFLVSYMPVKDSLEMKYKNLDWLETELRRGFQHVKFYFPQYRLPGKVVAFIGPVEGAGVVLTPGALAIGLQSFAGKGFSFYQAGEVQDVYPLYISRRFEPAYITADCMSVLATDIFPDSSEGQPLIDQIIIKGRYWWLANQLLPEVPDSIRTGYTQSQLNWCASNESGIWNYILQNTDPYTRDPDIIKNYVGEGPKTQGMPESSPGNIGTWVGWQIVKKYMEGHPGLSPAELMRISPKTIFDESKYKPK
jgi:hypothetical protein